MPGIAANAGYLGTFGSEAEESLDELRLTFQRKAHTAAMERCVAALLRANRAGVDEIHELRLPTCPAGRTSRHCCAAGPTSGSASPRTRAVVVDDAGIPIPAEEVPLRLRFAKAVRISIEGNAHFCRGLLATRYADAEPGGMSTHITDTTSSTTPPYSFPLRYSTFPLLSRRALIVP